jgi:glycosyltransferase involved in cell wall biosynthesis
MKVLLISTSVFRLNPQTGTVGYSGLENLVAMWAMQLRGLGCQVSVVCPEGSDLGQGIEIIPIPLGCGEDVAYAKYKDKLSQFDCCMDNSWLWFSVLAQMEADHQLPIIHCYHSDPNNLGSPPPIRYPCIVAFSEAQANIIRRKWNCAVQVVHHGIDLNFYKPDPNIKRSDRYLWLARYTPEKGGLEVIHLAKKCRVSLDMFGDTTIIGSDEYMRKCFDENDGRQIRVMPGISREETVRQYQSHKALITWPNYIEAWGLSTTEALACGCPVISKDSGAAREQIIQGRAGFVVSTIEKAEELIMTDAVSKLKTEDIVSQGRKFSIEKSAQRHLKLLQDVANGLYW